MITAFNTGTGAFMGTSYNHRGVYSRHRAKYKTGFESCIQQRKQLVTFRFDITVASATKLALTYKIWLDFFLKQSFYKMCLDFPVTMTNNGLDYVFGDQKTTDNIIKPPLVCGTNPYHRDSCLKPKNTTRGRRSRSVLKHKLATRWCEFAIQTTGPLPLLLTWIDFNPSMDK